VFSQDFPKVGRFFPVLLVIRGQNPASSRSLG
jgi:hypothetical protein